MLLPRRASAFREGHKKSSALLQKNCWEEPEKQKMRSPLGAGIIPKQCPMERVETERGSTQVFESDLGFEARAKRTRVVQLVDYWSLFSVVV